MGRAAGEQTGVEETGLGQQRYLVLSLAETRRWAETRLGADWRQMHRCYLKTTMKNMHLKYDFLFEVSVTMKKQLIDSILVILVSQARHL